MCMMWSRKGREGKREGEREGGREGGQEEGEMNRKKEGLKGKGEGKE